MKFFAMKWSKLQIISRVFYDMEIMSWGSVVLSEEVINCSNLDFEKFLFLIKLYGVRFKRLAFVKFYIPIEFSSDGYTSHAIFCYVIILQLEETL